MELLPSFSVGTWSLLVALLGLVILYGIWPFRLFRNLGIPGPTPLPFLGNLWEYRNGIITFDRKCFDKYGKVWGIYNGRQPLLAVLDPTIIKTVLVKECYTVFTNRQKLFTKGILKSILSRAMDEQWRRIRTLLSPVFTSGKLKEMFPIIKHYGETLMKNVQKKVEMGEPVDVKGIFGPYSMDVITSTSFGVNTDSMNNPNDPFFKTFRNLIQAKPFTPRIVLTSVFPFLIPLFQALGVDGISQQGLDFFARTFAKIKEARLKEGLGSRVDFLQLMLDSQDSGSAQISNGMDHSYKGLTDEEIVAQAFVFVFAGYETTSNVLGSMAYVLATHLEVQQKLQDEIDSALPSQTPPTYDAVMQLEYLGMVLSETLRMYPVLPRLTRDCKRSVQVNGVTIPKGTLVTIPVYILHLNPEYWPEPKEFRPERFSKENRENRDPYIYLPFGAGPRNCIGMRFALVTIKVAITLLLQRFSFRVCKETQIPLRMGPLLLLTPEKPIMVKLVPRNGPQESQE
ncbi:cytochrome P450 3A24-like isoform X1 [Varanus komodoensis]|uniref:cytochrome P450 3A24-like isoform X1 n=1 Tax=Varanus komodoensis TaxID=61221 RepID=UPI001CF7B415|nr:cytochrome P450 3A24-like isoform X1 [Varanus komodoensis]